MSRRNKPQENKQIMTADAFTNPVFRIGYGTQAPLEATDYVLTRMTDNYARINAMYRSGGILQSVIDIIPEDMTREWFTLTGNIPAEDIDALEKAQRKVNLKGKVIEGLRWGRLYGGAAGVILIKGQDDWEKPLNVEAVMPDSFKGLFILDRWSGIFPGAELVDDYSDPDFGLPAYYDISTGEGTNIVARVHHSRVVRFTGRELPYLEKLAEMYWGESEIEPIYEDVALYDSIMHNMGNLTFRANQDVMEVQNLDQLFSVGSEQQQRRFWSVMQAQSVAQSNFGTRLINKGDTFYNHQYTFTGFDHVTEAAQLNLAAKTHIPMTKLFGRSPAGMNATGESDMKNYYDIVDGQREAKLRPVLERILPVLCMSTWGKVPEDMQIVFPPLWTPTAKEIAEIAGQKVNSIVSAFQSGLLNLGPAQAELKKLEDETGMFGSIEDDLIEANKDKTFQELQQMQDPMAGLFGKTDENKGSEEDNPFEAKDYRPDQLRSHGKFAYEGKDVQEAAERHSKYSNVRFGGDTGLADTAYGFLDRNRLKEHFSEHGKEVGAKDERDYERKAIDFMSRPLDKETEEIVLESGKRLRYNYRTKEHGTVGMNQDVLTYLIIDKGKGHSKWESLVKWYGRE